MECVMDTAVAQRFFAKVQRTDSCWTWTGALGRGYGRFAGGPFRTRENGERHRAMVCAHRWSYEYHVGDIPPGLQLDHTCRNRACVNPDHLEVVSCRENLMRADQTMASVNSRKTHCPAGHRYTDENTYRYGPNKTYRACRTCRAERTAKRWGKA